jgi:hypothetical protein
LSVVTVGLRRKEQITHIGAGFLLGAVVGAVALAVTQDVRVTEFGDGVYLVGSQVPPGTYSTPLTQTDACVWARLSDATGSASSIIQGGSLAGPQSVTILPSDVAFKTVGCRWHSSG